MERLRSLDIDVSIWTTPCEIENAVPFDEDHLHAQYDPEYVARFHQALVQSARVMTEFRSRFIGKVSPVHFFWGSFDLAVTRFSGRTAPPPHGVTPNVAPWVMAEAYSHEVSSCGFWPGNGGFGQRRVLRLCLSGAGGLWRHAAAHRGRVLRQGPRAIHSALRRGAPRPRSRRAAARLPAGHLRRRRRSGGVGSRGAGAQLIAHAAAAACAFWSSTKS